MKSRMLARASLIFFLTLGVIIDGPFARAADAISLTASASSVAPGSTVDLTAAMPVVAAGSTTQTLTQVIDPTKVKLTSASDITYPAGWTLSYSTDGTTFSSTAPTTTSGWATIRALRASGPVVSSGSQSGLQMSTGSRSQALVPATGSFSANFSGGDPWTVAFDSDGRVFTMNHHRLATEKITVKCYLRSGLPCSGWSNDQFSFASNLKADLWVDSDRDRIWFPTNSGTHRGFGCISIPSDVAPSLCTGPGFNSSGLVEFESCSGSCKAMGETSFIKNVDSRIVTFSRSGKMFCLDITSVNPQKCTGPGYTNGVSSSAGYSFGLVSSYPESSPYQSGILEVVNGSVFALGASTTSNYLSCTNPVTGETCTGWTGQSTKDPWGSNWSTSPLLVNEMLIYPNASGDPIGLCYMRVSDELIKCMSLSGEIIVPSSSFVTAWRANKGTTWSKGALTIGSKVFFYAGTGSDPFGPGIGFPISCVDSSASWSSCAGFSNPTPPAYSLVMDPLNPSCIWTAGDAQGLIATFSAITGGTCTSSAPNVTFDINTIVPRMGCSETGAINSWSNFTLSSPTSSGYTSATLKVIKADGSTAYTHTLSSGVADLSGDSVAVTGQNPIFKVEFAGLTASGSASASVTAIGDAPELCTRVTAVYVCPAGSGPIASLANSTATVSASGSSVLGGVTTTLPQVDQGITITAPSLSSCTSSITGRAGDGGGGASGTAISGVTVSLLDSSGNPVLVNGSPVTTTTASDGTYSFANVLPASYKIRFNEPGTQVLTSSTVVSGATGTATGTSTVLSAATSATSNVAVTIAGTNAVVNALYTIPAAAAADTPAAGTQGSAQTINVLSNDSAASGATLTASTVRFCGLSPAQSPPSCSQTTLTTADGSYSVNTSTGVVTFTPNASFTGIATQPPTYQVTDSASNVVSATITPSVVARPTLNADTSSGAWDQNQSFSPLANDTAGNGASLVANSVKLCASGDTAPNCTATSRMIAGQGTYSVNSDGTITFDPLPSFTGTATPVTYSVTDSLGQKASTTITPSVSSPNAPIAAADTTSGAKGAAQSVNLLANDAPGIANNAGLTLVASSAKLCDPATLPAQVAPNCTATSVTVSGVGTYSISNGVVTFTPLASFSGTASPLPYQVADSTGQVATASYTPTVIPPPTLVADTSSGAWDQNQSFSPLANDTAGNGASLVANSVKLCASGDTAPNCTATSRMIAGQGTYSVNSDGTITFDPLPSFTGTATPVTYSVTDSLGQKSSTTITPSVSAPGLPVANPQSKLVSPTATTAFTTITGTNGLATGTQLSPLQTFLCDVAPNAQTSPNCNATTVTTTDGTWVLSQITGVATYQPNAGTPSGTKTAITYQVTDPAGQSAFALLTPVIPPAPSANPDSSSGQQAVAQVISLIGNDQPGMASSPIDVSSVKFCVGNQVAPNCLATSLTVSGQGTYSIDSLGIVTFTPIASFTGTATPITYQVSDSIGQSASSTLSVYVIPPPAPVATRDLGSAAYGQAVVFEPWTNDSGGAKPAGATQPDPQVVPTSIRLCASGQSAPNCAATTITTIDGSYNLDTTTGKVTFTPASGFSGTATAPVTYQISNNWTGPSGPATTTAILIPTIAAPGDPLATNDQSSTKPETPVTLKPIANDTAGSFALNAASLRLCDATDIAPNCSHLSVTNAHGTYVVDPSTGAVTFTPAKGFKGLATIPYVLSDMNTRFANANLFITVSSDAVTSPIKANEKVLAKTGSSAAYGLGAIAIISAIGGTALIASGQRKQSRS